ncbi:MAG: FtsX-like permease family protein [Planctomycetes bacterium]|nr:FtsX-like permease family protein [Planctomycetota bacterium]
MIGILRYHLMSLWVRRVGTSLSVFSIGMAVGILVLVLSLARGFELSLVDTGREDNILVLRQGASSEGESGVTRPKWRALQTYPGVAVDASGDPLASAEIYAAMNLNKADGGTANFPLRGVMPATFRVRDTAKLVAGREFTPGTNEVVVGKALLGRLAGCSLGGALDTGGVMWPVVGVIDGGGAAFDSEIWCDVEVFMQVFKRQVYGNVILRRATPAPAEGPDPLREMLENDLRLDAKTFTERGYFREQSGPLGTALKFVAVFIAGIMAIGAAFGTAVTLLASLAERRREIGTLLALGFRPHHVVLGFLCEATALGLAGGILGVLLALPVNGVATGTMNWKTFTEQAFAFRITPDVVVLAVTFSTFVGIVSGLLPAIRASRVPPSVALRG